MEANNFDKVAPYYDALVNLIFGKTLKRAQSTYLEQIEKGSSVLILGGGTGWILKEILTIQSDAQISYLEKSKKMLRLSKSKVNDVLLHKVEFIHADFEQWQTTGKYDYIVCNFFLDVFKEEKLTDIIIPKIQSALKQEGKLLVSDFEQNETATHRLLLRTMHWFFWVVAKLESNKLANIDAALTSQYFAKDMESSFRKGSVFSCVYSITS
ncbi:MAG: class I SAM-dependent methyltransferase [Cyclobacteriaceae bacterium]